MGLFLSYLGERGLIVIYTKAKERIRRRRRVREGRVRKLRLRHALLLFYLLIFDKAATPPHCYLLFLLLTSSTTTIQYVFFFFDHSSNEDEWKSLLKSLHLFAIEELPPFCFSLLSQLLFPSFRFLGVAIAFALALIPSHVRDCFSFLYF